jgi:pimeloyl-ACP methyl ester carboxylesterase
LDVIALMDALKIDKAHVVGHSMGAYTALHVGIKHPQRCISVTAAGCGWGSLPDPAARAAMRAQAAENSKMFMENDMATAAAIYTDTPIRHTQKYKDPRGYAEFASMLAEHSAKGHALTMAMLQAKRPTLWDISSSSGMRTKPALTAVCFSGAPRRRRACSSFRAPVTPSPARSLVRSMRRWPSFLPRPRAATGSRTSRPDERCHRQ